jgi:hypothetical protein
MVRQSVPGENSDDYGQSLSMNPDKSDKQKVQTLSFRGRGLFAVHQGNGAPGKWGATHESRKKRDIVDQS